MSRTPAKNATPAAVDRVAFKARLPWFLGILAGLSLGAIAGRVIPTENRRLVRPAWEDARLSDFRDNAPPTHPLEASSGTPDDLGARSNTEVSILNTAPADSHHGETGGDDETVTEIIRTADVEVANPSRIPRTLQSPRWASPIPRGVKAVSETSNPQLESMLHNELPFADASERQVWHDVLRGMPLDDAREIVRMRTRLSTRPLVGPDSVTKLPRSKPSPLRAEPIARPFASSLEAFAKAEEIIRHNIANAGAIGFLPGLPLMVESANRPGTRCIGEMVLSDQWATLPTEREADIVPVGDAFIGVAVSGDYEAADVASSGSSDRESAQEDRGASNSVHAGDLIELTKFGRMTTSNGFLAVDFPDGPRRVVPEIAVDSDTPLADAISRIQLWTVPDAGYLERLGSGRFRPTERSGAAVVSDASPESGALATGDIDVDDAIRQLELLQARRVLLENSMSSSVR